MNDPVVYVKKYDAEDGSFPVNDREVWRYAGYFKLPSSGEEALRNVYGEALKELSGAFSFSVCYRRFDISWDGDMPVLPFECGSQNLAKCLKGSTQVVMFAATIGPGIDMQIMKDERFAHTKALIKQAYGAERVESLCDRFQGDFEKEAAGEGLCLTPRFSPGYGDMPLEHQRDFFSLLDISHKIGISLGESLLMRPSKSVTAIFGLKPATQADADTDDTDGTGNRQHCDSCENKECSFRKEV